MKIIIILTATFCLSSLATIAQVNPYGVYIDIDGKIKLWTGEANRNGHIDDSVWITCDSRKYPDDLRNLRYNDLTLLEAPKQRYTWPSNLDPSRVNDTTPEGPSGITLYSIPLFISDTLYANIVLAHDTGPQQMQPEYYLHDCSGDGLNASILKIVKARLVRYINRHHGRPITDEAADSLQAELSRPDSMMGGRAIYDYLVDKFVVSDHDNNGDLTRVIGYHWSLGVETDSLAYNANRDLVYFSREDLGFNRQTFYFEYDRAGRVSAITSTSQYFEEPGTSKPDIRKMKFTYNKAGVMSSKSTLEHDGKWNTCYFDIR